MDGLGGCSNLNACLCGGRFVLGSTSKIDPIQSRRRRAVTIGCDRDSTTTSCFSHPDSSSGEVGDA